MCWTPQLLTACQLPQQDAATVRGADRTVVLYDRYLVGREDVYVGRHVPIFLKKKSATCPDKGRSEFQNFGKYALNCDVRTLDVTYLMAEWGFFEQNESQLCYSAWKPGGYFTWYKFKHLLRTQCISVFCMDLRRNSNYSATQQSRSVYCAVRTESLNIDQVNLSLSTPQEPLPNV